MQLQVFTGRKSCLPVEIDHLNIGYPPSSDFR
jgi:hypothetical protein